MTRGAGLVIAALVLTTVLISLWSRRHTATTVEFYLAGRRIGFLTNAAAICGDYFSAASFLGVVAAVYSLGLDGIWYGAGFGAGFVPVILFVAAPLRRFGEFTLPDFLAARYRSHAARLAGVVMVLTVSLFYMVPQMYGVGTLWEVLVGYGLWGLAPYQTGILLTSLVMVLYVALGGMRGTTWNQMIQFWVLFTAMALVTVLVTAQGYRLAQGVARSSAEPFLTVRQVSVAELRENPDLYEGALKRLSPAEADRLRQILAMASPDRQVELLLPLTNRLHPGEPQRFREPGAQYSPFDQFSVVLTLALGTMGLPHVMNRFYTNPSGRIARLTTLWVLSFVALFYMMASFVGSAARVLVPGLLARLDPATVEELTLGGIVKVPDHVLLLLSQGLAGEWGLGYVTAGAFAAMLSTIGGLLIAAAASLGHDLYEQYINPDAPEWQKVAVGKLAVVLLAAASIPMALGIRSFGLDRIYPGLIALLVAWAFVIAAATFTPALLLSIWWKRTTLLGLVAGMLAGGLLSTGFILLQILYRMGSLPPDSWLGTTFGQVTFPTLITTPLAFLVTIAVSLWDRRVPEHLDALWLRIHGTAQERQERRLLEVAVDVPSPGRRFPAHGCR